MTSIPMPQKQAAIPPMGFGTAIAACFSKYVTFNGRARRAEYWYWTLFILLLQFGLGFASGFLGNPAMANVASLLVSVLLLLPGFAVMSRRLHDTDRSAWWWLLCFTFIGAFVVLYWLCQAGTNGTNRYGPRTT